MAEAFEHADRVHYLEHHEPHDERHVELLADLAAAHARIAELEERHAEHCRSYHAPEPAEELEAEAEEVEAEAELAEAELEVPEPPHVEDAPAHVAEVAPRPEHWMMRRIGSHG